jgi:hypothetical protein
VCVARNEEIYFKVNDTIFATSKDIIKDDTVSHEIEFTFQKQIAFHALKMSVRGLPFSVFVNKDKIMEGEIFSFESSISCNCMVVGTNNYYDNQPPPLKIELGYPSEKLFTGKDTRNDRRLIAAMKANKIQLK